MKKINVKMSKYIYILLLLVIVFILLILCVGLYGYNSGSCKVNKKYICNDFFCLYKEFKIHLREKIRGEVNNMLKHTEIQKRVDIKTYPETILNCALPNKKGITIATQHVVKYAPNLILFYQTKLCDIVSKEINLHLFPTSLMLPTSCAILIYENEGDWINWHYDYNYYNGRFFTVLIPITNNATCTKFELMNDKNEVKSINLLDNNAICFEGNYLYHRASKLCKNERRIILSCQYVTDNNMNTFNQLRLKLKDFAYTGSIFL